MFRNFMSQLGGRGPQWAKFRGQVEIILDWFLTTIIFISM